MDTVRLGLSRRAPGSLRRAPWHRRRPAPRTRALAQGIRGSGRAGARAAQVDGRLHVHERQRHKLGDAAGARLQRAQLHQVPRPRASALHVPKLARAPALSSEQVQPHARTPAALRPELWHRAVCMSACAGSEPGARYGFAKVLHRLHFQRARRAPAGLARAP